VIPDLERQIDPERLRELRRPRARADEHPVEAPASEGRLDKAVAVDRHHLLPYESLSEAGDERRYRLAGPYRPAADVVERAAAGRLENRQEAALLVLVHHPVLDSRLGEKRRQLLGVRRREENALVPDERLTGTLAPFVPSAASAGHELDQVGAIVDVAEDPRVTGRLPASGLGRLEAADIHPGPRKRVGRSQPDDSGADDGGVHALPSAPARAATVSGTRR